MCDKFSTINKPTIKNSLIMLDTVKILFYTIDTRRIRPMGAKMSIKSPI